ncbi:hypothetical protein KP509_31G019300 [Ceratopteris richardii]|nr:hypothetical protein KP509_31G019300 [Ceratopteris richardii]
MRCILEKVISTEGQAAYECQTSEVLATEFVEWVETDECVSSCGLDRMTVGMSSDSLIEKGFVATLCSDRCRKECPNVMDLFEKLSAEEGVPLSRVCEAQSMSDARREMSELELHFFSLSANTLNAFDFPHANSPSASLNPQGLAASAPSPSPF